MEKESWTTIQIPIKLRDLLKERGKQHRRTAPAELAEMLEAMLEVAAEHKGIATDSAEVAAKPQKTEAAATVEAATVPVDSIAQPRNPMPLLAIDPRDDPAKAASKAFRREIYNLDDAGNPLPEQEARK